MGAPLSFLQHGLSYVVGFVQSITILFFVLIIVAEALYEDLRDRKWRINFKAIFQGLFFKLPHPGVVEFANSQGYDCEEHEVRTADGFILGVHRIRKPGLKSKSAKGVVLMHHGLFNTTMVFLFNGKNKALSLVLAEAGYDVWIANNRGIVHSRKHEEHAPHHHEFWDWTLDDLVHDVEACYNYVLSKVDPIHKKLIYIGHSQGSTQGVAAHCLLPELSSKTHLMILLAPACFVKHLHSDWLRKLLNLYVKSPTWFTALAGQKSFFPQIEWMRNIVPYRIYEYMANIMFEYLFGWSTQFWEPEVKIQYFAATPSTASVQNVIQWMQFAYHGRFCRYITIDHAHHVEHVLHHAKQGHAGPLDTCVCPDNEANDKSEAVDKNNINGDNEESCPECNGKTVMIEDYDVSNVKCPVALVSGGNDLLVDAQRLQNALPNVVYSQCVDKYFHLDMICAADAPTVVFPSLMKLMDKYVHV